MVKITFDLIKIDAFVSFLALFGCQIAGYAQDWTNREAALLSTRRDTIRWLDLSHLNLTQVPDFVLQCTALQELNLSGNRIHKLPSSLNRLHSLQKVNLSGIGLAERKKQMQEVWATYARSPYAVRGDYQKSPFYFMHKSSVSYSAIPSISSRSSIRHIERCLRK